MGALGVALALVAWSELAPQDVGGPISYVITSGNSMEPLLAAGDLVLVKEAESYEVGDAVAYRNPRIENQVVLHRIIAREQDGAYVFQGDNNDFIDPYRANHPDLIGKMWVRVAGGGRVLDKLRDPWVAALVAGGLGLMAIGGVETSKKRRKRGSSATRPSKASTASLATPTTAMTAVGALVLFLLLGVASFTRPTERSVPTSVTYQHEGAFRYSATAPRGPVYQRDVETGDPVFLRLVDEVDLEFDYALRSELANEVSGTAALTATIAGTNGWERTLPLASSTAFEGAETTVSGTMDLDRIRALISDVERETGVVSDRYHLQVTPHVSVEGTVGDTTLNDSFAPVLALQVDELQMQLPPIPSADGASPEDALKPNESVEMAQSVLEPNEVSIGPLDLNVTTARVVALLGIVLALVALAFYGLPLWRGSDEDDPARIRARYGNLLVPMRSLPGDPQLTLAEVTDVEALAKIATRYDRPILHEQSNGTNRYIVEGDGLLFVYSSGEKGES